MKNWKEIIFGAFILAVIIIFFILNFQEPPAPEKITKTKTVYNYNTLLFNYEIARYPSNVEIRPIDEVTEPLIGFDIDQSNLNFGIIPGNGSFVTRNIELTNKEEKDIKIILRSYGNISPLVVFSKNNIVLKPAEKVSVDVFLYSKNFNPGIYYGEIDVISQKGI